MALPADAGRRVAIDAEKSDLRKPRRNSERSPEKTMANWSVKLVDFAQNTTYTATLSMTDHGNGTASGELNTLSGPVPADTIDLNGSVTGGTFVLGGSVEALNVDLDVTFKPYVDGFVGSARIEQRDDGRVTQWYLLSESA